MTRPEVIAGVIRNGNVTDAETRYTVELAEYEARQTVLIVLPASRDIVGRSTLERARDYLDQAIDMLGAAPARSHEAEPPA